MIANDPVTGDILVADLGSDSVVAYALDSAGRLDAAGAPRAWRPSPGQGRGTSRSIPDAQHLFIVNELDSTVCTLRRQGDHFSVTDRVSTLPAGVVRRTWPRPSA